MDKHRSRIQNVVIKAIVGVGGAIIAIPTFVEGWRKIRELDMTVLEALTLLQPWALGLGGPLIVYYYAQAWFKDTLEELKTSLKEDVTTKLEAVATYRNEMEKDRNAWRKLAQRLAALVAQEAQDADK